MKRFHALLRRLCILLVCLASSMGVCLAQGIITTYVGDGSNSKLDYPTGISVDGPGNLYIADSGNRRVLRVAADGVISTFASGGLLRFPNSVALDASGDAIITEAFSIGNVIVLANNFTNTVLRVKPDGTMMRLGGMRQWYFFDPDHRPFGGELYVAGVAADQKGNVFVAEPESGSIWKITKEDHLILVSGFLSYPTGIAIDAVGNLFFADSDDHRIRKITPDGIITTVAGDGTPGFSGDGGPAVSAQLSTPLGVAVDRGGNLFIADLNNSRIRKVTPDGIIMTIAGNGDAGFSGDGGSPTLAQLRFPSSVAVDATGTLYIADRGNHRIRKVDTTFTVPTLAGISLNLGARTATLDVTLTGTSFVSPLTVDAGAGITVTDIQVTSRTSAQAKLTIAPDAALGTRAFTVGTGLGTSNEIPFTVVPPFPDLRVTTSHSGNLGVGFDGVFTIGVSNVGLTPTTSALTLANTLPPGLNFVSATGSGWSCSAQDQTVNCIYPEVLSTGAVTTLQLTVAVQSNSAPVVTNMVSVSTEGDLDLSSNSASQDAAVAATPAPSFQFSSTTLVAGKQETVGIALPVAFPFEVKGKLTLGFSPNAAIPVDDPAIQFSTGGRTVTYTIPANSLQARFATGPIGPLGLQVGTVAGALTFNGTLQAGSVETTFSDLLMVPQSAPALRTVQMSTQEGFAALITSLSTTREVTQLSLQFNTSPAVRLSCGTVRGCSVAAQTLSLDVRSEFDRWFAADATFGSLSTLKVPLLIEGSVRGTVAVTLRNARGISNVMFVTLP